MCRCLLLLSVFALGCTRAVSVSSSPFRTTSQISPSDLRTRLFAFADDSMGGREPGFIGDFKAAEYMAAEFKRLGLQPAGDSGTWFQTVPFYWLHADPGSTLAAGGTSLQLGTDFAPVAVPAVPRPIEGAVAVYAGVATDQSSWPATDAIQGKVVVLRAPPSDGSRAASPLRLLGPAARAPRLAGASLVLVTGLETVGASTVAQLLSGNLVQDTTRRADVTPVALISTQAAERLLGGSLTSLSPGATGAVLHGNARVGVFPLQYPARNVVAVLRGTDPAVSGQFVSLTAHNDHVGFDHAPVDHDSLRAFNRVIRPMGADSPPHEPSNAEQQRIRTILDSLRAIHPPRLDSIRNGADDDGTGSVALLEVAERLVAEARPRRSILFVSHTAEEYGLLGSRWFTDHPTVPIDSIIGEIDMDMVGRGAKSDLPEAGPAYLEVVGLRRLSTEFGDIIDRANAAQSLPFVFNLTYDQPGHPLQYYCRADHYSYARYGIPAIAVSRGEHLDYHQVTDEPAYIDYDALSRVTTLVHDAAVLLGNAPQRPKLDKPRGDPKAPCRQ